MGNKEDFSDIKPRPLEDLKKGTIKQQLPTNLERIKSMGKVSAKETTEMLVALGKLATSVKKSTDDDGKITIGDAFNFTDDILPLLSGVKDADQIPKEFADGFDPIEKSEMRTALAEVLEIDANDEKAVDAGLEVIFSLQNFLIVTGIVKPE